MFGYSVNFYAACAATVLSVPFVLTVTSPAYAIIAPLPPADCSLRDGTDVRFQGTDSEGISLVRTSGDEETVVLGFPDQRRGLTIRALRGWPYESVVAQLQTMIASPDTFNLNDVAATFDPEKFDTEIGYLSPELLRCMAKDN